jgi:uncharacterized membrane protein
MDFLIGLLVSTAVAVVLLFLGVSLVRSAKRRSVGALALGSILLLFGIGNVREPENQTIEQAKAPQPKKGEDSGGRPNDQET